MKEDSGIAGIRNEVETRSIFGGVYARWQDGGYFLASTISGGGLDFKSDRAIFNIMTGNVELKRGQKDDLTDVLARIGFQYEL